MSELFKLNLQDLVRGLIVAVLASVLTYIVEILKQKGLALEAADYQQILQIAFTALVAYLGKNLATSNNGKLGGKINIYSK